MQTMKRSLLLHSFILWNANLVIAKNEKTKERNLRVYGERSGESWDTYELQQIDMSMPTTAAPTTVPPTLSPSTTPTAAPTTAMPVDTPTTPAPTDATTLAPSSSPTLAPSSAPATSVETLPPTTAPTFPALFLDEDDEFIEFELVECQGDCDGDTDCNFGLICFQRDLGEKDVPACSGDADLLGDGFDDFCIKPQAANTLVVVGDEDLPASAFPLGECQGDCDEDGDCGDGLRCFQRDENESVPGCVGEGEFGWDYCFVPLPPLNFVGDFEMEYYQLQECEGDCDYDSDCALGLVCYFRSAGFGGLVPGCQGNAATIASGGEDYCILRPSDTYLVILADDDAPGNFPLPLCAGDCDNDTDCQDDLVCFTRDLLERVPGCEGEGEEAYDYCIPPDLNGNTTTTTP